jgi:hypothetical protein
MIARLINSNPYDFPKKRKDDQREVQIHSHLKAHHDLQATPARHLKEGETLLSRIVN